jgi:glycosyltransferase involved in cell wall biosynthesis
VQVAIAHDWLVNYSGSERCVVEMLKAFPGSRVLTTVLERSKLPPALQEAQPSLLQRIPHATHHHEWLLPLMPLAWRTRAKVQDVDAVVSSSHACAKAVRVDVGTPHLCYCHTPMRYAWDFESERERFPSLLRPAARASMRGFRAWDRATARRVTRFVANSRAVADRIGRFYGRSAQVIHPPVDTGFYTPNGGRGDEFLYVGRLVSYKRADLVVEAFANLPYRLNVVGAGRMADALRSRATPNVRFLGSVDDSRLRELYRSARAMVFPGDEDFGIVMAEAQACGTPVIALNRGGAVEIVEPGVSGWLLDRQDVTELRDAINLAATEELDPGTIRRRAERFSQERYRVELRAAVEEMVAAA